MSKLRHFHKQITFSHKTWEIVPKHTAGRILSDDCPFLHPFSRVSWTTGLFLCSEMRGMYVRFCIFWTIYHCFFNIEVRCGSNVENDFVWPLCHHWVYVCSVRVVFVIMLLLLLNLQRSHVCCVFVCVVVLRGVCVQVLLLLLLFWTMCFPLFFGRTTGGGRRTQRSHTPDDPKGSADLCSCSSTIQVSYCCKSQDEPLRQLPQHDVLLLFSDP